MIQMLKGSRKQSFNCTVSLATHHIASLLKTTVQGCRFGAMAPILVPKGDLMAPNT